MHDMRDGAVIGYSGDRSHFVAPNLVSAFQNPQLSLLTCVMNASRVVWPARTPTYLTQICAALV